MTQYRVQPRDRTFRYAFFSLAKNINKNIGKNISKNVSGKYSKKLLDHDKNLLKMHLKLPQKE